MFFSKRDARRPKPITDFGGEGWELEDAKQKQLRARRQLQSALRRDVGLPKLADTEQTIVALDPDEDTDEEDAEAAEEWRRSQMGKAVGTSSLPASKEVKSLDALNRDLLGQLQSLQRAMKVSEQSLASCQRKLSALTQSLQSVTIGDERLVFYERFLHFLDDCEQVGAIDELSWRHWFQEWQGTWPQDYALLPADDWLARMFPKAPDGISGLDS
jgi:hypothetical protein